MICIPIMAKTTKTAITDMKKASNLCDIIELRVDYIKDLDLKELLKNKTKPVIVTNRSKEEKGNFKGTEQERVDILKQAIQLNADYIDIELRTEETLRSNLIKIKGDTKIIISSHDFFGTDPGIIDLLEDSLKTGADIIKIVTYAKNKYDNLMVFDLLKLAHCAEYNLIAFCMGKEGRISRIISPLVGSYLTYASLTKGKETAPGQITVSELKSAWKYLK